VAGQFTGKVVLVTGGASGIGRATALRFARDRASVIVADVDAEGGQETAGVIKRDGGKALFVQADVSKAADAEGMVCATVKRFGRLDFAFNNAGIVSAGVTTDRLAEDDFNRTFAVNVKGVWLGMKYEIPQMLEQGGGCIVNTSSIRGLVSYETQSAYSASKHAVIGLTRVAALEYASQGVRINAICPGIIRTPGNVNYWKRFPEAEQDWLKLIPLRRYGTPEEIAEAVAWLCSDQASFVHGHAMVVDGGTTAE
jgi:NAD(P)-dependent dehydrogenase (short-subunit alcohol dehydrogenase family)